MGLAGDTQVIGNKMELAAQHFEYGILISAYTEDWPHLFVPWITGRWRDWGKNANCMWASSA
eukprot:5181080-Ditylum_brightwellii.AAC.2